MEKSGFDQAKDFAKELTDRFSVSANKTRVSILTFSHYVKIAARFRDLYSRDLVRDAVDKLAFEGSVTGTAAALLVMKNKLFTPEAGARLVQPGEPTVIL